MLGWRNGLLDLGHWGATAKSLGLSMSLGLSPRLSASVGLEGAADDVRLPGGVEPASAPLQHRDPGDHRKYQVQVQVQSTIQKAPCFTTSHDRMSEGAYSIGMKKEHLS